MENKTFTPNEIQAILKDGTIILKEDVRKRTKENKNNIVTANLSDGLIGSLDSK